MKLWKQEDVLSVMDTEQFKEEKLKADKRRHSSRKAVETKNMELQFHIMKQISEITVSVLDDAILRHLTLDEKQDWYWNQSDIRNEVFCTRDAYSADDKTIDRWVVNYIRHNLTKYDKDIYDMSSKVGCHEAYYKYRSAVLDKIAEAYPKYAKECMSQKYV